MSWHLDTPVLDSHKAGTKYILLHGVEGSCVVPLYSVCSVSESTVDKATTSIHQQINGTLDFSALIR